jgi:branched-chain amino acid transport system permease protein
MDASAVAVQLLNGLAEASSLFLVASGLSLIFGVTRIVNFAHGSLYMLGLYVAYAATAWLGGIGAGGWSFWLALACAAVVVGLLGAAIEIVLLRRIYRAPELSQLLATFALVLMIRDAVLWLWGPDDLLGPRAPGLAAAIPILGRRFPSYDLLLIAVGPLLLAALWLLLHRTRFGTLVRAATEDREMTAALGIDQARLFTAVFALGSVLAGLGGALQLPRTPANLDLDMATIGDVFVVVVVGGMGSIPGAYLAALLIAEMKALCIAAGTVDLLGVTVSFPKLTLVAEFVVMAVVLALRPWGLLGRPQPPSRNVAPVTPVQARAVPTRDRTPWFGTWLPILALAALPWFTAGMPYVTVLAIDLLVAALFAASLHFLIGPGGMPSFGHAAYFGLGAYGAALLVQRAGLPMEVALVLGPWVAVAAALLFGWFCVRLSGIYLAMLTLAFAQIVWSIAYQWDTVTGGSNGLVGVWPAPWLSDKRVYYELALALCGGGVLVLRRVAGSPFGYALRAGRDSSTRAEAIGIDVRRIKWLAFAVAALFGGLAGASYAFSKGSISPDTMSVGRSVDGLVMVMLGGLQSVAGPVVGAVAFTSLQDVAARATDYWRALAGSTMLVLVLTFPQGIVGVVALVRRRGATGVAAR